MQLKNLRPLCFLWFDRKLSPTWVVYICFTTGRRWISKISRFFFWLKQWLFVFYTNAQVCFYSAERVFTACSRPTKGHVVPQILQPLQGKCVSWLNQQHQAQMIAPPEGWRLIDWFFFFSVEAIAAGKSKVNTGFSSLGNGWPLWLPEGTHYIFQWCGQTNWF